MSLYRFQIDSGLTAEAAMQRIRAITRDDPGFLQSVKESFGMRRTNDVPFIGSADGGAFQLRRDIRYRNSFLPRVNGRVEPTAGGSRLVVKMSLHAVVGLFVLFWLGGVSIGILAVLAGGHSGAVSTLIPLGMFVFGVALTLGGFYPEAFKARRILEKELGPHEPNRSTGQQAPPRLVDTSG